MDADKTKWNFYIRFKVSEPLGIDQNEFSFLDKFVIKADTRQSLKEAKILRLINLDSLIYREIIDVSKKAEQALILAFAELGIGISYPYNLASEAIAEKLKVELERAFVRNHTIVSDSHYEVPLIHWDDKFGVVLFPAESTPFDTEATKEISPIDADKLKHLLISNYNQLDKIFIAGDEFKKIEIATAILATSLFDDSLINKIILSMTAIEVLSEKLIRPNDELEVLEYLVEKINEADTRDEVKKSMVKATSSLRYQSINKSCKNIIKHLLGKKDAELFYKLYDYRSQLVHTGTIEGNSNELYKIHIQSYSLAKKLIAAYVQKSSK